MNSSHWLCGQWLLLYPVGSVVFKSKRRHDTPLFEKIEVSFKEKPEKSAN